MQRHFSHHLHPGMGHYDEQNAIEVRSPCVIARKGPGAEHMPDRITRNPLIKLYMNSRL